MTKYLIEESWKIPFVVRKVFSMVIECIFMAPPARLVPQLMDDLFAWMKSAQE